MQNLLFNMQAKPFGSMGIGGKRQKTKPLKPWHTRNALNTVTFPSKLTIRGCIVEHCSTHPCTVSAPFSAQNRGYRHSSRAPTRVQVRAAKAGTGLRRAAQARPPAPGPGPPRPEAALRPRRSRAVPGGFPGRQWQGAASPEPSHDRRLRSAPLPCQHPGTA